MTLAELNLLPRAEAVSEFLRCCGSTRWAEAMSAARPFASEGALFAKAETLWASAEDHLEAFSHHPRIGDVSKLREKFAATRHWATEEQKGAREASETVLQALAQGNLDYEKRFGHVFLVCATGKSALEMLELLQARIHNDPETELRNAALEQVKITRIRLEKLLK